MELLEQSLEKLHLNYLSRRDDHDHDHHHQSVNLFIFHEGDFDVRDILDLESRPYHPVKGLTHLVNLTGTPFWKLPDALLKDDPSQWKGALEYKLGYRHMMRWYAVKIWDFFDELNTRHGCHYEYIMRMDEESYIHSPIEYDVFNFMTLNHYEYAFRQCSYEMGAIGQVWHQYVDANPQVVPLRTFAGKRLCGFYNNFFIATLSFFKSPPVQHFLQFVDQDGAIYRHRVNDLVLQTAVVYAFLPPDKIYRYLDFTYEHFTMDKTGCPRWGGIMQGYNDIHGQETVLKWADVNVYSKNCTLQTVGVDFRARVVKLRAPDLSPTYQHLDKTMAETLELLQVAAGLVDLQGQGVLSG
jgi:hypothetical protein